YTPSPAVAIDGIPPKPEHPLPPLLHHIGTSKTSICSLVTNHPSGQSAWRKADHAGQKSRAWPVLGCTGATRRLALFFQNIRLKGT
ncbi:hypothetical protein N658DRAFT_501525, partial [Parathielavia hyrcaniae]